MVLQNFIEPGAVVSTRPDVAVLFLHNHDWSCKFGVRNEGDDTVLHQSIKLTGKLVETRVDSFETQALHRP